MADDKGPIMDRYAKRPEERKTIAECWQAWETLKATMPNDGKPREDAPRDRLRLEDNE